MSGQVTFRHLRLTGISCFREYLKNNARLWGEIGNEALAGHVRSVGAGAVLAPVAGVARKGSVRLMNGTPPGITRLGQ